MTELERERVAFRAIAKGFLGLMGMAETHQLNSVCLIALKRCVIAGLDRLLCAQTDTLDLELKENLCAELLDGLSTEFS